MLGYIERSTTCKLIPDTEGSLQFRIPSKARDFNGEDHEGEGINWFRPAQCTQALARRYYTVEGSSQ